MNFETSTLKAQFKLPIKSKEELEKIKKLKVNKISLSGEILKVNYEELLNFPNLETLYFENCTLDFLAMSILTKLNKLKKLYLINCEILDDNSKLLANLNLENLVIDHTVLNFNNLPILKALNITLARIDMPNIKIITENLDIANVTYQSIDFLNNIIASTIKVPYQMYIQNENVFNLLSSKIIVLEENTNFVYKEVN